MPQIEAIRILKNSNALTYHKSLPAYKPTPLIELPDLAKSYGVGNIYVKDESHRLGLNAFKGLGASYAMNKILKRKPEVKVFCTATDGNHGRAIAWAAKLAERKAVIFVPGDTTQNRINAIAQEGAEVIQLDLNYDETCVHAEKISREKKWELIQDTAYEGYTKIPTDIMAGYLTHFKEMEDQVHCLPLPKIDLVFLQAGVGSWAASAIWYYLNRYGPNRPKLVIVEPNECAGVLASFEAGKRIAPTGTYETIMAGLNCGIPSLIGWEIIEHGADAAMKISDNHTKQAMRALYKSEGNDTSIIAGESGAAGFAGFIALMTKKNYLTLKNYLNISEASKILFYNTEGATDSDSFNEIINELSEESTS